MNFISIFITLNILIGMVSLTGCTSQVKSDQINKDEPAQSVVNNNISNNVAPNNGEAVIIRSDKPLTGKEDPDMLHGVRTKWLSREKDMRNTIIPDLHGLPIAEWAKALEDAGVNCADINIDPRNKLLKTPKYTGPLSEQAIADYEYTVEQRNTALIDFLKQVREAEEKKLIKGNIRFVVHQRLWIKSIADDNVNDFVEDMSEFINLCRKNNVDYLINGIRHGENNIKDLSLELRFPLKVTEEINAKTDNWLKGKTFLMGGAGNRGAYFKGINKTPYSDTFFEKISAQTGAFAFTYKHYDEMSDKNDKKLYMTSILNEKGYKTNTKEDWINGLTKYYGLDDAAAFISTYRGKYPNHANVVFVGDSADCISQINIPAYDALTAMFSSFGDGFKGNLGMNGFSDSMVREDSGRGLLFVDKGTVTKLVNTYKLWNAWPQNIPGLKQAK